MVPGLDEIVYATLLVKEAFKAVLIDFRFFFMLILFLLAVGSIRQFYGEAPYYLRMLFFFWIITRLMMKLGSLEDHHLDEVKEGYRALHNLKEEG